MDETAALHTAARRYCIDHNAYTDVVDVRLLGTDGRGGPTVVTDDAESIMLGAILLDVEGVVPDDFATADEMRTFDDE